MARLEIEETLVPIAWSGAARTVIPYNTPRTLNSPRHGTIAVEQACGIGFGNHNYPHELERRGTF